MEPLEQRRLLSVAAGHAAPAYVLLHAPGTTMGSTPTARPDASPDDSPYVFTPALLRKAYGMDSVKFGSVTGDGTGQTIAIVDAYDDPTIAADLKAFDADYGLPNPTLKVISQTGSTTKLPPTDPSGAGNPNGTWEGEEGLDVEWAHAVAPKATIVLVETNDDSDPNLYAGVNEARGYAGVSVVSCSWGGDEQSTDASNYNKDFTTPSGHANVTFVASAGDNGAYSDEDYTTKVVGYPAASANVVGVGGTSLTTQSNGTYVSESGWGDGSDSGYDGGGGGGISSYAGQPTYQKGIVTQSTTHRTVPDVSLDADPNTGVVEVDSYDDGNYDPDEVGGTSLAAPLWAGVIALADQGRAAVGEAPLDGPSQTLPDLYKLPATDFHDVTTGSNGYSAAKGYDLVAGLGTPIVNKLVLDLVSPVPVTGTLLAWNVDGQKAYGTNGLAATAVATGVTDSAKLTRGSGLTTTGTALANAWGGTGFAPTSAAGLSGSKFVSLGLTVGTGKTTSLSSVTLDYARTSTGPANGYWQYQLNGGTWTEFANVTNEFPSTSSGGATMSALSLAGVTALQSLPAGSVVNLRLTPYGATSTGGQWYVYDGGKNRTDLSVTAAAAPSVVTAPVAAPPAVSTDDARKHKKPFAG